MRDIYRIEKVDDYNKLNGVETLHPLVSIIDFSKTDSSYSNHTHFYYGVYAVFLKEYDCGELRYGRNKYDYQEGSLVFVSPGQVLELIKNPNSTKRKGWALLFHPDLIHGTNLGKQMGDYTFFSYEINEALHISERERKMVMEWFEKISFETSQPIDKHSKKIIVNNIQLFLDYCIRFYDRQFITRSIDNKDILTRFESLLNKYFQSELPVSTGFPTVKYCADQLHLSPNYFGDLIKKETGKSAQEHIQLKILDLAKERIFDSRKSIGEIAYELGFKYPQHFSRLFKTETGLTPNEYRLKR